MHLKGTDDVYLLETDSGHSITLTGREAAELVDIARQIRDRLASQRRQGFEPVHAIEVTSITARIDAHHTQAVLVFEDQQAIEAAYVLSLDQAKSARDMLDTKISQIETAAAGHTKQ